MTKEEASEAKKVMIDLIKVAIKKEDWHLVSDLANDIRELEASVCACKNPSCGGSGAV